MNTSNHAKVQRLQKGQLVVTIPIAIAKMKGIEKGTVLEYVENESGELVIRKVKE